MNKTLKDKPKFIQAEVTKEKTIKPLEKLNLAEGQKIIIKIFDADKIAELEEGLWNRLSIEQFFAEEDESDALYNKL